MIKETVSKGFTKVPNYIVRDKAISFKARGVLNYMLSRPSGWKFFVNEIVTHSANEGKSSVQSALKELMGEGYVNLVTIRDKSTSRIKGKRYVLCIDVKGKGSQIESPTTGFSDQRETVPLNKNEESKKELNNKTNHQQKGESAAVEGYNIDYFFEEIRRDEKWHEHFLITPLGKGLVTHNQFELILYSFRGSSLKGAKAYKNLLAVKKHFLHWFNFKKGREELLIVINEERKRQHQLIDIGSKLIDKSDKWTTMRFDKSFPNVQKVLDARKVLEEINIRLMNIKPAICDVKSKQVTQNWIDNNNKIIDLINRGEKANQLDWFCKNAKALNQI